jgi:hypothetical protein
MVPYRRSSRFSFVSQTSVSFGCSDIMAWLSHPYTNESAMSNKVQWYHHYNEHEANSLMSKLVSDVFMSNLVKSQVVAEVVDVKAHHEQIGRQCQTHTKSPVEGVAEEEGDSANKLDQVNCWYQFQDQ